jgi:hypothetical protein
MQSASTGNTAARQRASGVTWKTCGHGAIVGTVITIMTTITTAAKLF